MDARAHQRFKHEVTGKLANLNNVGGDGEVSKASKAVIKGGWRNLCQPRDNEWMFYRAATD